MVSRFVLIYFFCLLIINYNNFVVVHLVDNDIGALTGNRLVESKYLFVFMVISVFVFVTGATFMVATCIFMRKHSTASISRVCISEAAYDNPTYKVWLIY